VEQVEFDSIHLLSNYSSFCGKKYRGWLNHDVEVHTVKLDPPTDYTLVFKAADKALKEITAKLGESQLCIHLSPGTPTMAATWVLLGKSRYPATFYQTYGGTVVEAEIPFDLYVDFLPEVLGEKGLGFQHLINAAPSDLAGFNDIIGDSPAMKLAKGQASQAALLSEFNVLLTGESGTGKELFSRAIHNHSRRQSEKFVAINCAAISSELIESELFGHVKGAFTGANTDKDGAFAEANGGTLFLDEIGECDPRMQAKLLRVLQPGRGKGPCHRVFQRVGESVETESDVRIIAATNQDLAQDIQQKRFRDDLFYRLAEIPLQLPPLRERKSDIQSLVEVLLKEINDHCHQTNHQYEDKTISNAAISLARKEEWPGNVRQLRNALVRASVMGAGKTIEASELRDAIIHLPASAGNDLLTRTLDDGFRLQDILDEVSVAYIEKAKEKSNLTKKKAAELLGLGSATSLDNWLKRLGLNANWKDR
jgi:transcriptional regulator with PAS, ATPase and Fis domain